MGVNFSAISNRALGGQLLRVPLRLIPPGTRVPILQGRLRGRTWIVGSSNHGCWLGSYEYHKRRAFEKIVRPGSVVFDVGAHVGFYTLLASALVGPQGRVFAFEPHPRNLKYLKQHLDLNAAQNVFVFDAAVSDCSSLARFQEGRDSSTGRLAPGGQLRVKTVTLDGIVARGQAPPPDCIKIDVEGSEMLVLEGGKSVLSRNHPTLFLATHGKQAHQECCHFLDSLGYVMRPIDARPLQESSEVLALSSAEKIPR